MKFTTIHFGLGSNKTGQEPECFFVILLDILIVTIYLILGQDGIVENDYVYIHDQEPVWLDLHEPLFDDVKRRNDDINWPNNPIPGHIIVSERGEFVEELCKKYGWTVHTTTSFMAGLVWIGFVDTTKLF
jgi:hypothetical protein